MGPWLTPGGEGAETGALCSGLPPLCLPLTLLTAPSPSHPHPEPSFIQLGSRGLPPKNAHHRGPSGSGCQVRPRPRGPAQWSFVPGYRALLPGPGRPRALSFSLQCFFFSCFVITVPGWGAEKTSRLAGHWSLRGRP